MKTPEQIAKDVDEMRYIEGYTNARDIGGSGFRQAIARAAVKIERVQQERSRRLPDGEARFTIRFDPEVWPTLDADEQQAWLDRVNDAISAEAYVTLTEVGR